MTRRGEVWNRNRSDIGGIEGGRSVSETEQKERYNLASTTRMIQSYITVLYP